MQKDYAADTKSLDRQLGRAGHKKEWYAKRRRLLERMKNRQVLEFLGLLSLREIFTGFEEGQQDILGRVAWRQEFDVVEFLKTFEVIKDNLMQGNIRILPRIDKNYEGIMKLSYHGIQLKDDKMADSFSARNVWLY